MLRLKITRRTFTHLCMASLCTTLTGAAMAQGYPDKPIKLIVSYPAGGPSDAVGRAIGKEMQLELGQPVFIENKAGVSGLIGLDALTGSPADGHTIMVLNNTTTTALLGHNKPLDFDKRMSAIGQFVGVRMLLVVNPKVIDVHDIGELVTFAKKSKQPLQYTTSGPGAPAHLLMTGFSKQEQFESTHIPYKGSNPALMDTVAGRVGVMLVEASSAVPHIRSGALRALACISPGRAPLLPDLKTSTELGFPNLVMDSSFGMIAPPGTPPAILNRLGAALQQATKKAEFIELQRTAGNAIDFVAGPEYRERLIKDHERWSQVVKTTGISLQ